LHKPNRERIMSDDSDALSQMLADDYVSNWLTI
jgi:hypothetical protein